MFKKMWWFNNPKAKFPFNNRGELDADGNEIVDDKDKDKDKDKPTVESLQADLKKIQKESGTYRTEKEKEVSGLIKDLQDERNKNKPKDDDDDDDDDDKDPDADKTFLTKKQVQDLLKTEIGKVSQGLIGAHSDDKLVESVDKAKVKYVEKAGHIPYQEVIEKGFLEFAKRNPGLLTAMKTATDPAEFAYMIGLAHPVFASRRKAKVTKEIVETMKKPKITPITGADGKTEITGEQVDDMSSEEFEALPEKTRLALLMGSGTK